MPRKKESSGKSPGRPHKPVGELREKCLTVRLTPAEYAALVARAAQESRGISDTLVVCTLGRRFT